MMADGVGRTGRSMNWNRNRESGVGHCRRMLSSYGVSCPTHENGVHLLFKVFESNRFLAIFVAYIYLIPTDDPKSMWPVFSISSSFICTHMKLKKKRTTFCCT